MKKVTNRVITQENWIEFIQKFFKASGTTDWMSHVASGWNHLKSEPGCNCSFTWYSGPVECDGYKEIQASKLDYENSMTIAQPVVDVEGVANYLERDNDFYESDEPVSEVIVAFDNSTETGVTSKPEVDVITREDLVDATTEEQLVKDFEEEGPGHGYWEKGDH
jgi:hypothetical protein